MLKEALRVLNSLSARSVFFYIKEESSGKGNVFQEEQTKRREGASLELDKRTNLTTDGIQNPENLRRQDDRGREVL